MPDRAARGWALLATSLGFGVVQLDVSVVNVAVKSIGAELGRGTSGLQWVVNAYTVAFAALILTAGALGDRVGAKRVFLAGFALFTLASVGCGLAPSLGSLISLRALQGVGAAVLVPCSLTLLNHAFPDSGERARAVGLWAAGASVALSAGPLVGGLLIASLGWRAIFFINIPIGVAGIALTMRYADETPGSRDRGLDPPGQTAAIISLLALAGSMIEGGQRGFSDPVVLAGLAAAALAGATFVIVEARQRSPMLPLGLFSSSTFSAATAIGLLINVAFYGLIFVFSLYFQTIRDYSPLVTGLAFAPSTIAVLVGNLIAGRVVETLGDRRVLAGSALLIAAALGALLVVAAGTPYLAMVGQLTLLGFGLGLLVPTMTTALLSTVKPSLSGIASGTLNTARQSGSVIGVALFGALIGGTISGSRAHLLSGIRLDITISVALALAACVLSAAVRPEAQR